MKRFFSILFLLCALALVLPAQNAAQATSATPPELVRQQISEWVKAKKILAAERAAWAEEQQQLADLNTVRRAELTQLDALLTNITSRTEQHSSRRAELAASRTRLASEQAAMTERVTAWENALRPQLARFPEPLRRRLGDTLTRLEGPAAVAGASLQGRVRDVVFVLSEATAFHHKITVDSERRALPGVGELEFDVLYLGLAQGWYVDRSGTRAGRLSPGPAESAGWVWSEDPSIAAKVRRAIRMVQKDEAPAALALPFSAAAVGGAK